MPTNARRARPGTFARSAASARGRRCRGRAVAAGPPGDKHQALEGLETVAASDGGRDRANGHYSSRLVPRTSGIGGVAGRVGRGFASRRRSVRERGDGPASGRAPRDGRRVDGPLGARSYRNHRRAPGESRSGRFRDRGPPTTDPRARSDLRTDRRPAARARSRDAVGTGRRLGLQLHASGRRDRCVSPASDLRLGGAPFGRPRIPRACRLGVPRTARAPARYPPNDGRLTRSQGSHRRV